MQIVLRAKGMPPGIRAGDLTIPPDKNEAVWTIDVQGGAAEGIYTFWAQGEARIKFAKNPQSLQREKDHLDALKAIRGDESKKEQHAAVDQAIKESEEKIKSLTESTKPVDRTVFIPAKPVTIKVIP